MSLETLIGASMECASETCGEAALELPPSSDSPKLIGIHAFLIILLIKFLEPL